MSSVDIAMTKHITLGYLAEHYGFDVYPDVASAVTITSLVDDVASLKPGSLYVPHTSVDVAKLYAAQSNAAYAALVPHALRRMVHDPVLPLLVGEPSKRVLGAMAADVAGNPSYNLAIFAVHCSRIDETQACAIRLTHFLHMLGNPVSLVCQKGSSSLDRELSLQYPLNAFDVQRVLAIGAEEGCSAVIISLDSQTLQDDAMQAVEVDVIGGDMSLENLDPLAHADNLADQPNDAAGEVTQACNNYGESKDPHEHSVDDDKRSAVKVLQKRFGFDIDAVVQLTVRDDESDEMAQQTLDERASGDSIRRLSLAIAMTLAAGVRRGNIKSALRVAQEFE